MQDMQGKWPGLKALRYGLLLAVSVATLSGCVSAVSTDMRADNRAAQENEDTVAEGGTDETTTPVVSAGAAGGTAGDATADSYAVADAASAVATDQQAAGDAAAAHKAMAKLVDMAFEDTTQSRRRRAKAAAK